MINAGYNSSLLKAAESCLTQLDRLRQEEEDKAYEKARTIDLSDCVDSLDLAIELANHALDSFEKQSQEAFSEQPKDFPYYVRCSEPLMYPLINKIQEVIEKRLLSAEILGETYPRGEI